MARWPAVAAVLLAVLATARASRSLDTPLIHSSGHGSLSVPGSREQYLLFSDSDLDDLGAHPRRSPADRATVIRATGPALGEQMAREEWRGRASPSRRVRPGTIRAPTRSGKQDPL